MVRHNAGRAKMRTRHFIVALSDEANKRIIDAAATSMFVTVTIKSTKEQPPIEEIRRVLDPVYEEMAVLLEKEMGQKFNPGEFDKLHVEFNISFGNYRLRFSWETEHFIQTFVVDVKTEDQKSLATRFIELYGNGILMPPL